MKRCVVVCSGCYVQDFTSSKPQLFDCVGPLASELDCDEQSLADAAGCEGGPRAVERSGDASS